MLPTAARKGALEPAVAERELAFLCPEDFKLGAYSNGFQGLKATLVLGGTLNEGSELQCRTVAEF